MNMARDMDATFVNQAVASGAMRIDGEGVFRVSFFRNSFAGQSAPDGKNWRTNCFLRGGDDFQHGRQN
jgi:hypothetical protein